MIFWWRTATSTAPGTTLTARRWCWARARSFPGSRDGTTFTRSKSDAMKLVDQYLRLVSSTHGKLKLSSPTVKRMFYIPCMLVGDSIELPSMLSGLEPRSVAALGTSRVIIL